MIALADCAAMRDLDTDRVVATPAAIAKLLGPDLGSDPATPVVKVMGSDLETGEGRGKAVVRAAGDSNVVASAANVRVVFGLERQNVLAIGRELRSRSNAADRSHCLGARIATAAKHGGRSSFLLLEVSLLLPLCGARIDGLGASGLCLLMPG